MARILEGIKRRAAGWCCVLIVAGAAAPQAGNMADKQVLAKKVETIDAYHAQMVLAPTSSIEDVATPFLKHGAIYKVTYRLPQRPVVFTVGALDTDGAVLLSGRAREYWVFTRKAELNLTSDDLRTAYLRTFLEVTRSFGERFQILESAADLQGRPGAGGDEAARLSTIQARYQGVIRTPRVTGRGPWAMTVFALRGENLVRIQLTLLASGSVQTNESTLEHNLPIPYGL